jgi:competence protein ComEA helix-hairpin-helix repeat region
MIYINKIKKYIIEYKLYIIAFFIFLNSVCIILLFIYSSTLYNRKNENIDNNIVSLKKENKEETIKKVKVDIKGEVINPGLYEMNENKRIDDIIKFAILSENADTSLLNLSKKLEDEMVIIIHSKEEVLKQKKNENEDINEVVNTKELYINSNKENNSALTSTININTATIEQLMTLSGIGESKAKLIIEYRSKTRFNKIEDIKNIKGIGDSIFEKIKNNITV